MRSHGVQRALDQSILVATLWYVRPRCVHFIPLIGERPRLPALINVLIHGLVTCFVLPLRSHTGRLPDLSSNPSTSAGSASQFSESNSPSCTSSLVHPINVIAPTTDHPRRFRTAGPAGTASAPSSLSESRVQPRSSLLLVYKLAVPDLLNRPKFLLQERQQGANWSCGMVCYGMNICMRDIARGTGPGRHVNSTETLRF